MFIDLFIKEIWLYFSCNTHFSLDSLNIEFFFDGLILLVLVQQTIYKNRDTERELLTLNFFFFFLYFKFQDNKILNTGVKISDPSFISFFLDKRRLFTPENEINGKYRKSYCFNKYIFFFYTGNIFYFFNTKSTFTAVWRKYPNFLQIF